MRRIRPFAAVLTAIVILGSGWSGARANCQLPFMDHAIFQCSSLGFFGPPPFTVQLDPNSIPTNIRAVFWQVGFGNDTLNNGGGRYGAGLTGSIFNGNDSGLFKVELKDAPIAVQNPSLPAGSTCFSNNNWSDTGFDGCCDNERDASLPYSNDGFLNPIFDVYYEKTTNGGTFVPSLMWVQDSPIMAILREPTGTYFAVAAVSSGERTVLSDVRPGFFDFGDINDGLSNPAAPGKHNLVPWQTVPGVRGPSDPLGLVRGVVSDLNNPPLGRIASLGWNDAVIYSDNASRPSTNANVATGMGTAEAGPLVRYVVETQAIVDPNNPIGSLNPGGWSAAGTFLNPVSSTTIAVQADTCIRLHTYFGHSPETSTFTLANCRLGRCGDLGYDVVSPPSCIGGPLVAESPIDVKVARERAGSVTITWKASIELTTTAYRIDAVTRKGSVTLGTVPATATGSGTAATYAFTATTTQLKGARSIEVIALPSGAKHGTSVR